MTIAIDKLADPPWQRSDWKGSLLSVDGCSAADFTRDDVECVVEAAQTRGDWDGKAVAIVQLRDGRFVAWETWWDCTGSGFCADAYGGGADILFSSSFTAIREALTESAREMLDGAR